MTFHSTSLKRLEKHCPVAFLNPPTSRDHFAAGIAAHAVIEEVTRLKPKSDMELRAIADAVAETLITKGRSFDGNPEPALPPNETLEGRDVAINWLINNGIPEGDAEVGLAVDKDMNPVPYDSEDAYYAAILDLVSFGVDGDEDFEYDVVIAEDYKSAWSTGPAELGTLQRKGQAVVLWAHYGDRVQCIRQRVRNLRTGGVWDRDHFLDEVGKDQLAGYWEDVKMLCRSAEHVLKNRDKVQARPGSNCIGCHLAGNGCNDAWELATQSTGLTASRYAAAKAVTDEVGKFLRQSLKNSPAIDGVGYHLKVKRKLADNAIHELAKAFASDNEEAATLRAILTAAQVNVSNADAIAKALFPGRSSYADRVAFMESITEQFNVAEFGIYA